MEEYDVESILDMYEESYVPEPSAMAQGGRIGFKRGTSLANQRSIEEYVEIVKNMLADPTYVPTSNINQRETGPLPNLRKAKEIVKEEVGEAVFEQKYNANISKRKKLKANEKLKADPNLREKYLASKAERRRKRRVEKIGDKTKLTPKEKFLNFQQSLITKQLNEKVRNNPDIILKNPELMEQLETTVAKDGTITNRKVTLNDIKNRGIFEIEHQRDIYKKGAMKDFPYNRNLILGPHNRADGFKNTAEKFIENNPDSPKINAILEKAKELKITLQPDVPKGTFKTKGLGYKQIANPVDKFLDVAKGTIPEISQDLGLSAYTKNLSKAKSGLGIKSSDEGVTLGANLIPKKLLTKSLGDLGISLGSPTALLGLNAYLGVDPTESLDRAILGTEAALAPAGIKALRSRLANIKNPIVRKSIETAAGLRLPGVFTPANVMRAARFASPVGIATLAGEGLYQLGKLGYKEQQKINEMRENNPEAYQRYLAEQQEMADASA